MDSKNLLSILSKYSFNFSNEKDLQSGLEALFKIENIPYEREYILSKSDRIDFLVGSIGVEVKTKGSYAAVLRQLWRYAEFGKVAQLILVTTKASHLSLPNKILEKPIYIFQVINF